MSNKCEAFLPPKLVKDSTVLDLGCCIGAMGQWALYHGAAHYSGVELQQPYAVKAQELLTLRWPEQVTILQAEILTTLDNFIEQGTTFDVVVACGVIYSFFNPYELFEKIAKVTRKSIVIDCSYPAVVNEHDTMIEIRNSMHINYAGQDASFVGVGVRLTPDAARILMKSCGFEDREGLLLPKLVQGVHDIYRDPIDRGPGRIKAPGRYALRFVRTGSLVRSITDDIVNNTAKIVEHPKMFKIANDVGSWKFDAAVAERFQAEAQQHIPDYERVIELCVAVLDSFNNKHIKVIDVGSALGYTLDKLLANGFTNVFGVEASDAMIAKTLHQERVFSSSSFVMQAWDAVLINWTLHFIDDRVEYLKTVFDSLTPGGVLILTDKMDMDPLVLSLYHDLKSKNGVSAEVIAQKAAAVKGVLNTKPVEWYLDTLTALGFSSVQIINSRLGFNTLFARKP
jgi:SAM-dependent methyltransferase